MSTVQELMTEDHITLSVIQSFLIDQTSDIRDIPRYSWLSHVPR